MSKAKPIRKNPKKPVGECIYITDQGWKNRYGYWRISIKGRQFSAHRVRWVEAYGPIPKGMFICHHCDNRMCVNIKHLFLGTQQDNMDDMKSKKRAASRENGRNHQCKKTHCAKGHPFDETNTKIVVNHQTGQFQRVCKICRKVWMNKCNHKRRGKTDGC